MREYLTLIDPREILKKIVSTIFYVPKQNHLNDHEEENYTTEDTQIFTEDFKERRISGDRREGRKNAVYTGKDRRRWWE